MVCVLFRRKSIHVTDCSLMSVSFMRTGYQFTRLTLCDQVLVIVVNPSSFPGLPVTCLKGSLRSSGIRTGGPGMLWAPGSE